MATSSSAFLSSNLDDFWQLLLETVRQLHRHYKTDDLGLAERLLIKAEDCQTVLRILWGRLAEAGISDPTHDLEVLMQELQGYINHYTLQSCQSVPLFDSLCAS